MKNWDLFVFGPLFAIDSMPLQAHLSSDGSRLARGMNHTLLLAPCSEHFPGVKPGLLLHLLSLSTLR